MSTMRDVRRRERKDWRVYFTPKMLEDASALYRQGRVQRLAWDDVAAEAQVEAVAPVRVENAPASFTEEWSQSRFSCPCDAKSTRTLRMEEGLETRQVCVHEAALLLAWEEAHGPWRFEPPETVKAARAEAIAYMEDLIRAAKAEEAQVALEAEENARLEERKEREQQVPQPAADFFPPEENAFTFFDIPQAVQPFNTTLYHTTRAEELLSQNALTMAEPRLIFLQDGRQALFAVATQEGDGTSCEVTLCETALVKHRCTCQASYYDYNGAQEPTLCEHELVLLRLLRDYIRRTDPGDITDRAGLDFLQAMGAPAAPEARETAPRLRREKRIALSPRVSFAGGQAALGFTLGAPAGNQLPVSGLRELLIALESRQRLTLADGTVLNFGKEDLTEESLPWLNLLRLQGDEPEPADPLRRPQSRDTLPLTDEVLDGFYRLSAGKTVPGALQNGEPTALQVGYVRLRLSLTIERQLNRRGVLLGLTVSGQLPPILRGSANDYFCTPTQLSAITPEDARLLRPFTAAANQAGAFRFQVGSRWLAEFCYRILPRLMEADLVRPEGDSLRALEKLLPPEPTFTFLLDCDAAQGRLTCLARVTCGQAKPRLLPDPAAPGEAQDAVQERRVLGALRAFFPHFAEEEHLFWLPLTAENRFRLLTEGCALLARYGEYRRTPALRAFRVRKLPRLRLTVALKEGTLTLKADDRSLSQGDILAARAAWQGGARCHTLPDGTLLDLTAPDTFLALEAVASGAGFSAQAALAGQVTLPASRILLLDTLLAKHPALLAERDQASRALLRRFRTLGDAPWEVPPALARDLRPYQLYGYRWLRTMAEADFGGVLADELGLGKTLQVIALLEGLRDGAETPSLILCPAPLMGHWAAELERYAPARNVLLLGADEAARSLRRPKAGTVLVADLALAETHPEVFRELRFGTLILDEAQHLADPKAPLRRALQAIAARRRFALTESPVEERPAALWSLFDLLLPGFLGTLPDFLARCETGGLSPAELVAPFLLRRRKAEVLADLPARLDAVYQVNLNEEERKRYDKERNNLRRLLCSPRADKAAVLTGFTRLRLLCCGETKQQACLELAESARDGGHRLLILSRFPALLARLDKRLRERGLSCALLTGSAAWEQRLRLVQAFNEGSTPILLLSQQAECSWLRLAPGDVLLTPDTCTRLPQANGSTLIRLVSPDTLEAILPALREQKPALAEALLSTKPQSLTGFRDVELLNLL